MREHVSKALFTSVLFLSLVDHASAKPASLVSLTVSPSSASVAAGLTQQFSATGKYSDGSTKNITSSVAWASSNSSVASINTSGLATGLTAGLSVTITATSGTLSGTATLQVTPKVLSSISVTPSPASLSAGHSQQFQATGKYSDGSTSALNSGVVWSSTATNVATISATGLAQAVANGTTTITARLGSVQGTATLTVSSPKLLSISVSPSNPTASVGKTVQFSATGTYSDNSTQDITTSVTWKSSNTRAATITSSGVATAIATGSPTITASEAGGISGNTTLTVTGIALVSIAITPANSTIPLGTTEQLTATGTYSDGSTQNLSSTVAWSSSNTSSVTVSSRGLAAAVALGSTTITATSGSISGQTALSVSPAVLASIAVTPTQPSIALGTNQQFLATGTYTDGSTKDITSSVTWASSAPSVATIASTGLASSKGSGTTSISASSGTIVSNSASLTVLPAALQSISVTPANASLALGATQQYLATGTYSDGSTQNLTNSVTWSSDTPAVATISTAGLATSVAVGSSNVSATSGVITGTTSVTITPAQLVSIAVTPAIPSVPLGTSQQFTATGTYTDNSTRDLTASVHWSSGDPSIATISNSPGSYGLAASDSTGATTITAISGSVSGSTTLTVSQAALVSIALSPANPSITLGTTQQFSATGTYTDSSANDLTGSAVWSSSSTSIATIDTTGLAHSMSAGSVTLKASVGTIAGSTTLTVTPAALVSITVAPSSGSIPLGTTQAFTATGNYADGSTQDLTSSAFWSTSDGTIATISDAAGTYGLATSVSVGSVTITATSGSISGTASLSITPDELVSIAITPQNPSIALGKSQQFTATGTYSDQSTKDITTNVTWTSSSATVAVISNNTGSQGSAVSSGVGSATITATMGSVNAGTTLTVGAPQLVSIAVTPVNPSISAGTSQQFTAMGTYTDNSTADLTASVVWASSNSAVATINSSGVATATGPGSTTISATSGLVSGSTVSTVFVPAPVLTAVIVSPANPSITLGNSVQFTATAVFSDASTLNITNSAIWTSSNTTVATVGATGLAASVAQGSSTVNASYGGQVGSTGLTVSAPVLVTLFEERFNGGSYACTPGGSTACLQPWGYMTGSSTATVVSAPSSGWNYPTVLKLAKGTTAIQMYTAGSTATTSGTQSQDLYVEFYYDNVAMEQGGKLELTSEGAGSSTAYSFATAGNGYCWVGKSTQLIVCAANQRHLLHVHLDSGTNNSYDQIDGGATYPFTAAGYSWSWVKLYGARSANLYFGSIVSKSTTSTCLGGPSLIWDGSGATGTYTDARMDAATFGGNDTGAGWSQYTVTNLSFSLTTAGSSFSTPVNVCGASHAGNSGNAVLMTLPPTTSSAGTLRYAMTTLFGKTSVGFAFSYTSTGLNNGVDFFAIGQPTGVINNLQINSVGGAQELCFENDRTGTSSCIPVALSPGTQYWISFGVTPNGDDTLYLYSYPDLTLLGSVHANGSDNGFVGPDISFYIGKTGNEPIDNNMTLKYWNLLIDLTKTAPLLPH